MKALLFSILFTISCCTSFKVESAASTCKDYVDRWAAVQTEKGRIFAEPRVINHSAVFSALDTNSKIQYNLLFTPGNHLHEAGENFVGFCLSSGNAVVTVTIFDFTLPEPKKYEHTL